MDAQTILVIILSSFLALFLLLGIILLSFGIKLAKKLNEIAESAEDIVHNVESASEVLKKAAGPMAAGKFVMNIAELVMKKKKEK